MRLFLTILFCCLSLVVFGQEAQTVVAEGYGVDQRSAERNAIRSALEQAIGSLVDAETLIKNDKLVNDQV